MTYALVQWDDGYIFKLTLLAHVKFPPHKPYIVAKHDCAASQNDSFNDVTHMRAKFISMCGTVAEFEE